ncbi:BatD family protein [Chitinophagaceae bacterium LB-8]|uniref:BatD family protein n=1 Tax=Paraflavisolibacter caeni TaxID=2982496 RepID=A0A9X3BGX1_9BACT|nr:BatD family protein [Paraflavisolibacter caeni]MCU7548542.1 BatD family protein [Paraflavisolibacter caeni]
MNRYLLFILLLSTTHSFSQRIAVAATASDQNILIGEPFQLTLGISAPGNQKIDWFDIKELPHFEILSRSKIDSQVNGNKKMLVQTLTLTSWDSGRWQLPSFSVPSSNKTKPIAVEVSFSNFDPKQPYHDVKDILEVNRPGQMKWYWYLVGLLLLAGLFFLLFPGKKKKKEEVLSDRAYKKALTQLEALRKKNIAEQDAKLFYSELIQIFREYLHRRMNIQSFSKTTEDLGRQLGQLQMPQIEYQQLLEVLQLSDFVKFARYKPSEQEHVTSYEVIKKSIVSIENIKTEEKHKEVV